MDVDLKCDKQVSAVVRASFGASFLNSDSAICHYYNVLYSGISQSLLARLQMVLNAAACLLTGSQKYDLISPFIGSLSGI